ncbi:MAG: leucine-rich repeat domain-containing protein, partial [Clostridia bacterium]|nr:leucine-rich repeat domain-containing protein [Clostridia bacterium]
TSIGKYAFGNCYSLASVVISEGVTSIGDSAFYNCYSLASVVIPEGVTSIGNYAFRGCTGMKFYDFTKHTSVPTLAGTGAFNNISSDCKIRVPAALYDEWISATNWSTYANKIVTV